MKKILFLLIFVTSGFLFAGYASAGVEHNVSGYAWSENIGWISFNNTSGGGSVNYGVSIDSNTGKFSGYAWSENIGWIDFAPSGPYPASPNYSACLDFPGNGQACDDLPGNNKIGGWARVLSYGGGWDGWIKLRGDNYGVEFASQSGELSGWAWSDMVIGWISFKGVNYGVVSTAKLPPQVSASGETFDNCSYKGKSVPILNWNYTDGTQAAYWIQIDDTSASFNSPEVDTGEILSSSHSYTASSYIFNWDERYFWRVKAKNQQGVWSNWSNVENFDTIVHAYPWVDFAWMPSKPTQGEILEFNPDESETFGGTAISSYLWTVTQGTATFADDTNQSSRYPHMTFSTLSNKVQLQITDSDNYFCESSEKDVSVELPLPEYREVPPASFSGKILVIWSKFLEFIFN